MRKYWVMFLMEIQRLFTYRARVTLWVILDISTVAILPFFWLALYGDKETLAGFTRADMVTYYIVVGVIGLCATSHVSRHVHESILKGTISKSLVQPYQYLVYHLVRENSYKVFSGSIALLLVLLLRLLLPTYFILPSWTTLLWFFFFLVLSRLLSFFFEVMIGLGSFWLAETSALKQIRFLIEKTFSGQFAPLALFPEALRQVAGILPFQYLYYIPAQAYLEKIPPSAILQHATSALLWTGASLIIVMLLWKRGLYRFDGAGI